MNCSTWNNFEIFGLLAIFLEVLSYLRFAFADDFGVLCIRVTEVGIRARIPEFIFPGAG
jgi:hypothetical protein